MAKTTTNYKGHELWLNQISCPGGDLRCTCGVSGPGVNDSFYGVCKNTQAAQTEASTKLQGWRQQIDQREAQQSGGGGSTGGSTGGSSGGSTGGSNTPQDGESSQTQNYKGHDIKTTVNITSGLTKITVQCTGPGIQETKVFGPMANQSTVGNQGVNYINELKSRIDQRESQQQQQPGDQPGTQPETQPGTQPGGSTQPGDPNYPFPQIVFEDNAMPPNAGTTYQTTRNNWIADQFYNQMKNQVYYSGQQVATEYFQKLMAMVNSHEGSLQINFGNYNGVDFGQITSPNKENYSNTSAQIRIKMWQLYGVSSWDQRALKSQGALGGDNGSGTGTSAGTGVSNFDTETPSANATFNAIQNQADQLLGWLDSSFNQNLADRQSRFNNMPDLQSQVNDRVNLMNTAFQNAASNLKAAGDLEKRAQAIYSNENISKMNQQLQQKGFDPSKAGPAVFFKAMKDRAQLSAEVYKLQADQEKNLATLETQRAQLVDNIKAAGMEADQWTFQQLNEITKQIEELRNNYDLQRMNVIGQYTLKPMLDVMSAQYEANMQNIVDKYQNDFLDANPSQKVVAAARIFGNDWYYVSSSVALSQNNLSLPFGKYLVLCGDDIRQNKTAHEQAVAAAGASNINVQGGTGGAGGSAYA